MHDHLGNEIRLPPKPFAVGGEGAVFDVVGMPDLVAKLYNKPQNRDRCDKLRAMANLCSPELLRIAAWPKATLHNGNPSSVDGILMPRIADHVEIHHLYSVAQRKKEFPEADWGFLLHTARNCAIAFESIHQHGHVVGDVNQKNVMVSRKGIVALVDSDSFQVKEGARVFRCGVGVPEYTPPELHGKSFASLDRTANHDNFGLAVLVFHLLMMGRHPFSGVPQVNADIPIEKAIQEGLYAYARNPTKLKPPPHIPPVSMLDSVTLERFERAFGSADRPTATEWRATLDAAMKRLVRCKNDPRHSYLEPHGKCPWCQLIALARVMFFLPGLGASAPAFRPEEIEQLIRKLAGMQLAFATYTRPKPVHPIRVSLPPELKAVRKPGLQPHPAPPAPVDKPKLLPMPQPPALLARPYTAPHPPAPPLYPRPLLARHPDDIPFPKPPLKPHPVAPLDPPRPRLLPLPPRPGYPESPELAPPDPFLLRLSIGGVLVGLPLLLIAAPVGFIVIIAFGTWLVIMVGTEKKRQELALNSLKAAHKAECARIDEAYAEQCGPAERTNRRFLATWEAKKAALAQAHRQACEEVNKENHGRLAAWESADAARKARCEQACREIDNANNKVLAEWDARNAVILDRHRANCEAIDRQNRAILDTWREANFTLHAEYDNKREEAERENERRLSAWEAVKAARQADHDRACRAVDEANRRMIAAWEVANAPWLNEEKRWHDRAAVAESDIVRLEAMLSSQRSESLRRHGQRKIEAEKVVAENSRARRDYEQEIRQAEMNSERIQREEHLEKSLIRSAKLKGITGDRILSLESFGIETAKDVPLLLNQKVPGIGPVLSQRLFDWHDSLATSFRPKKQLPESEKNRIANRFAPVLLPLRQSIQGAVHELEEIARDQRSRDTETIRAIAAAVQQRAVAEAYLKVLKIG